MIESLEAALARVTAPVLDPDTLVRAVASGRRRGEHPQWRRVEARYVDLKAGRALQVTAYDDSQAHTSNHPAGEQAAAAVAGLVAQPFGNWHVETVTESHQLRVTKKGDAVVHSRQQAVPVDLDLSHDRDKGRLLAEDDPVFRALGLADEHGRIKPSRQAKYRQVEEFLRILDAALGDAMDKGHLRRPTPAEPLRIADLGCGNAYLTFAAQRFLTAVRGLPVRVTGVDVREQSRRHNADLAAGLGIDADFVVGSIGEAVLEPVPEVVLALHACDTATDEALARAAGWGAPLVLAAPCCHHDIAAQLRRTPSPAPYGLLTRHGILRERFADTLTDAVRAALMRSEGYRVEVVQFVESKHTPRNTLLRAVRTGSTSAEAAEEYAALVAQWQVTPRLAELLAPGAALGAIEGA
jgi:SAM-dependent methyltransferase